MFAKLTAAILVALLWLSLAAVVRGDEALEKQIKDLQQKIEKLKASQWLDYYAASQRAVDERKPLIFFYGTGYPRNVPGCVVGSQDYGVIRGLESEYGKVVVSVPGGDWLVWRASLPADATDAQIIAQTKAVSQRASFFPSAHVAHDDNLERGPWPVTLAFPKGFERYRRARMTQEIAVTNNQDRITPIPRESVNGGKWARSGGMMAFPAVRSDLYRFYPEQPTVFMANIPVLNSFGSFQHNRGWWREFATGTAFMDVLSLDGRVFEVRKRSKLATGWESDVIFEAPEARPVGYNGKIGQSCASCHEGGHGNAPGSGPYAGGLVPGSDSIYSVPFDRLE